MASTLRRTVCRCFACAGAVHVFTLIFRRGLPSVQMLRGTNFGGIKVVAGSVFGGNRFAGTRLFRLLGGI